MTRKPLRRKPKQERSAETLAVLQEAAAQVLLAEGYARTTTNRIAERAGVSIGSLYQYFENKDAVLVAVLRDYVAELLRIAHETDIPADASLVEQLRMLVLAGLQSRPDGPRILVILSQTAAGEFRPLLDAAKQDLAAYLTQLGLRGSAHAREEELRMRVWFALDAIEGLFVHAAHRMPAAAFATELAEFVGPYLSAPGRAGSPTGSVS
jgi:AcrR family transcriptional regulator